MFIITLTYKQPLSIVDQFLEAHRSYLDQGYEKNFLIASGPKNPRDGGVMISQLTDKNALEIFLANDPFKINDVADYQIIEFSPVKFHKDFAIFMN